MCDLKKKNKKPGQTESDCSRGHECYVRVCSDSHYPCSICEYYVRAAIWCMTLPALRVPTKLVDRFLCDGRRIPQETPSPIGCMKRRSRKSLPCMYAPWHLISISMATLPSGTAAFGVVVLVAQGWSVSGNRDSNFFIYFFPQRVRNRQLWWLCCVSSKKRGTI